MDAQPELASHLQDIGLEDTEYWLAQLDKKLDVKSKTDLDLLEGDMDSFLELKEVVRQQEEVEILKRLIGGEEKELCMRENIVWETLEENRNPLSNFSVLLQTISGGRALRAVLLTQQCKDQLSMKERLLEAPKEVLIATEYLHDNMIFQFSSQNQEDEFKKAVDVFGRSAVMSGNPVHGIAFGAATSSPEKGETTSEENYMSTIKYSIVEVANYSFKKKDLKLSEDPKSDLHNILKLLRNNGAKSNSVQVACEKFLYTYGSHVSKGLLKFGGFFLLACSSSGFSHDETKAVEKMQSDIISAAADASFVKFDVSVGGNIDKIIKSHQSEFMGSTKPSIQLQRRINGGPLDATNFLSWKAGLMANNSTWVITDCGKKLVPVWDIIRINYKEELGEICEVLQTTWERMSELKAEQRLPADLIYDPESVLEEINYWMKENLTPQQIDVYLAYLSKVKNAGSSVIWISEYLSEPIVQNFLESVVDMVPSEFIDIKSKMQRLVKPEELRQFDTTTFPSVKKVFVSLHSCQPLNAPSLPKDVPDFQSFDNFLEKTINKTWLLKLSSEKFYSTKSQETNAMDVSKAIDLLRSHYQHTYDDIFVTILVHLFQSGNSNTLNPMSLNDLESMRKSFSEQRKKFDQHVAKKSHLHLQTYLFELAVNLSGEAEPSEFQQFMWQIAEMMRSLEPPLNDELEECLDHAYFSTAFRDSLRYLMAKPHPLLPKKGSSSHSLSEALRTEGRKHQILCIDHSSLLQNSPAVHSLFMKIGLDNFYPKKLQLKDALCIRPDPLQSSLNEIPPTDPQQLPYLVLHKLMAYDINCRSDLSSRNDDYAEYDEEYDTKSVDPTDGIHPVDILLALILCSDDFLRQDLYSRLAKCQLSVPFILPDPFTKKLTIPLWAMRSIIKEWKCTKTNGETVEHTEPIVSYPMPIVSFICFQKQKDGKSKSAILNEVISEAHSHFFHRDCPGGHYKSLLGEGLVDMCWYLPAGQAADAFTDAVTFLNLHGDAREHPQQSKFLSQISFACIVLLTEEVTESDKETMECLKMFSLCPGGILLLDSIGKNPKIIREQIPDIQAINMTKKNASEVKVSIRKKLHENLVSAKQFQNIEDHCKLKLEKIYVDEDNYYHRKGLSLATEIKSMITGDNAGTKETMLPLQGKHLWQAWAAEDRELHRQIRRGARTVSMYTAEITKKKALIREQQMEYIKSLTPVTESFIVSLLKLGGSSNAILRNYFLQCLKLELDNLSRINISGMQLEYQATKRKLTKLQDKSASQEPEVKSKIEEHKDRMKELQDGIIDASIGLEHLFREVGQVYEAAVQSPEYNNELSCLPRAVAELLIDGYPLEVMDGDAAHVPLKWVAAVFDEAVEILVNKYPKGSKDSMDPKVFVLSVLGLQSTGKSTMLNTAFGLQFNVSAGRCTRGAFVQLLPLDETLRKQTKCDYVLVVDTEGLRALELDPLKTQKHDNELATFVIGLANMTLINIYGEVPGDMDDILQTSVHAFLRMTRVKISPSCQFVHQNAGSNVKSEVGRTKFTQKLNMFTVDAAHEEKCEGQYETFNDVIKFDDQKDVHHFPGLWKGDPPMAPVNRGYSRSAQTLKLSCVEVLDKRVTKGQIHFSSFRQRVENLWDALLKENFVFSFKNTLEITAYNSLETEYCKWEWAFHAGMLEWEQKAENEIRASKLEAIPDLVRRKRKDLKDHVHGILYEPLKFKMDEIFEGRQADILIQWKEKFERRLINLSIELQEHAEKHLTTLQQSKVAISKIERDQNDYAKKITEKVHEYIQSIRQDQERLNENLKKRKLEQLQLQELLGKELFTPEKLIMYERKRFLTPEQVSGIKEIMQKSGGTLTETGINTILVGQLLGVDQVKRILKMGLQTEEELKIKFNQIWIDLVKQHPFIAQEQISVEDEVEGKLTAFVHSSQGKLIALLQKRSLTEVESLELVPERNTHYSIRYGFEMVSAWFVRIVKGNAHGVEVDSDALEVTARVFTAAREYLSEIEKKDTDFNAAYTQELLHLLTVKLHKETAKVKHRLTFTPEYRLDIFLTACGYAIPKFKKMRESFRERHDPHRYLENHIKGPLFTKFKNQYYQAEAEEAIANTFCAHLEEPIRTQVRNKLGSKMVGLMKASEQLFSSKMALKVKILTDLYKEDKFESYMHYVKDVKGYLKRKLKHYIIKFCDEKVLNRSSRLQEAAKQEITNLKNIIEKKVSLEYRDETDVHQWVTLISEDADLKGELGALDLEPDDLLDGYESLKLDLKNLKGQIKSRLKQLEDGLHSSFGRIQCGSEMNSWKDKPHILLESLFGCTEQCPFCGEQCDLLDPNHVANGRPHSVEVHRSSCLRGYRNSSTEIMVIGFCPSYISGNEEGIYFKNSDTKQEWHPYKEYQSIYPNWSIPPDVTSQDSLYWKMFLGKYMKKLASTYGAKPAVVPDEWSKITWEEAQKALANLYKCK